MSDFEHVNRYLAQAAEEPERPFGNTEWISSEYVRAADRLIHGIPVVVADSRHDASEELHWPWLFEHPWSRRQSGVSELAERLRQAYLEGMEEDTP